jgi:hypothetical protein
VLALVESSLGEHAAAIAHLEECRASARARGHALWVAQLSYDLGRAFVEAGRAAEAHATGARVSIAASSSNSASCRLTASGATSPLDGIRYRLRCS